MSQLAQFENSSNRAWFRDPSAFWRRSVFGRPTAATPRRRGRKHGVDFAEASTEYDFSKGVRGKHHAAFKAGTNVVLLDADVARAFPDSSSVNRALRLLLEIARKQVSSKRPA